MIKLCDIQDCTGCAACINVCPVSCISPTETDEGFMIPLIDASACTQCGLCVGACPPLNPAPRYPKADRVYAAFAKDDRIRCASSSGGLFSVFAERIVAQGGSVFGAGYDPKSGELVHKKTADPHAINELRGSKYYQSDMGFAFREAHAQLRQGKNVLFSGTPCQIAGFKKFLGARKYPTLVTVEVVCHGVPSPAIFRDYLRKLGDGLSPSDVSFRKRDGWDYLTTVKNVVRRRENDLFMQLFLRGCISRECCYRCEYADQRRVADVTIGDFWGIGRERPFRRPTDKGVSLAIVNSHNGSELWKSIHSQIYAEPRSWDEAMRENHQLYMPPVRPRQRDIAYEYVLAHDLRQSYRRLIDTPYARMRRTGGKILKTIKLRK